MALYYKNDEGEWIFTLDQAEEYIQDLLSQITNLKKQIADLEERNKNLYGMIPWD